MRLRAGNEFVVQRTVAINADMGATGFSADIASIEHSLTSR